MARLTNPGPLFYLAKELNRPLIGFDWGDIGFGLCIVDVSRSEPRTSPIPLVESNSKVNYALTPLEMAIRDFRRTLKPKGEKSLIEKFDLTQLIPLQVLRPAEMTMFDMASIVNDVATRYDAVGYVSGYSADSRQLKKERYVSGYSAEDYRQWKMENSKNLRNKVFFQNFLKDLNATGGLSRKLITICNEKNSTKFAQPALAKCRPLYSVECFLNSYKEFGMADRLTLERKLMTYGITSSSILQKELDVLRKSRLDCLAAADFTKGCALKVFNGDPYRSSNYRKEMSYLFTLCENVGITARDDSFLIQGSEDHWMECFSSDD